MLLYLCIVVNVRKALSSPLNTTKLRPLSFFWGEGGFVSVIKPDSNWFDNATRCPIFLTDMQRLVCFFGVYTRYGG